MTQQQFVVDLKADVMRGVTSTIEYLANPPVSDPPDHLGILSRWYRKLPDEERKMVCMAMEYAADGSLFGLLNILDGMYDLPSGANGKLELYYVENGKRIMLNDPEGDFLYDLFNNN